jgi:hypothetical protein
MSTQTIAHLKNRFDAMSHRLDEENIEFWFARELMEPLDYTRWENFQTAIQRAIESCKTTGYVESDHFRGVTKMVKLGSGSERPIDDFMLTRPLADFLPTLTIAAKNLATEMTNHNVQQDDLHGEPSIAREHVNNNDSVRTMLGQRGILPERLPAEEDIKKLERRVKSDEKKLEKQAGKLPKPNDE